MERLWRAELSGRGVEIGRVLSKPTLGNGLLWRLVGEDAAREGYWVGYRSLLDAAPGVEVVRRIPRGEVLLGPLAQAPRVARLRRVCADWISLARDEAGTLVLRDVRYGQWGAWTRRETPFVFAYRLRPGPEGVAVEVAPRIKVSEELRRSYARRIRGR